MNQNAYALLIGINKYLDDTNIPTLKYAEKDCMDMYNVLTNQKFGNFPKENVKVLIGPEANTKSVKEHLYSMVVVDRKPEDLILVYYSGHAFNLSETGGSHLGTYDIDLEYISKYPDFGVSM